MKSHASMNRIYRLVWNHTLGVMVAVAENAKGRGKSSTSRGLVAGAVALTGGLFLTPFAQAGPTGGQVSAGSGTIAQVGLNTTINQSSQNLAINWQGFSIAANEAVRFNQPSASSIALNRVIGQNPSQILGSLSANGQVFVVNPNGVLFGSTAQVNVGGLVASTLGLSDADLMAGKFTFNSGAGTSGTVVNQGSLTAAQGGYIALLAPEVRNEGVIVANRGTALLAAGDKVTLNMNNGSLLGYNIDQGALNALADNKQLIQADGGQVFMGAKAADALTTAMVNNTGILQARTVQNVAGVIKLMGDMQTGTVNVGGTLDASAPTGGNGGFIETSAAHVKVADGAKITTQAASGLNGTWLIDPVDFTIAATGGDITGATLSTNLLTTDVVIFSTDGTVNTTTGLGDINVNDAVNWSAHKLTLTAVNDININAVMSATGTASLDLEPTSTKVNVALGSSGFTGRVDFSGTGALTINGNQQTVISDVAGLQAMDGNAAALAGHYALGSSFDAASVANFTPVGTTVDGIFSGSFDGLGHTVSHLTINQPGGPYVGLFNVIGSGAMVRNIGLVGGSVTGGSNVGGLVGANYGTISNSYATGAVKGRDYVGGLVGNNNYGTISNSYSTGSVSGANYVGGLVGTNYGTISNSYSTGSVSGANYVGGLVGANYGTVSNSYYNIDTAKLGSVGLYGIYGDQFQSWKTGGLTLNPVTYFGTATATNAYTVTGVQGLKDLLGFTDNAALTFNLAGNIDMTAAPVGFYIPTWAGTFDGTGKTISNFTLNNPNGYIGFFGTAATGSSIKNLGLLNVNVTGTTGSNVGGLAGANHGTISNSYATGNVTVTTGDNVGGLAGANYGTISNSYATGNVSGTTFVGGLVSYNSGTVSNSYATGNVSGTQFVGGLVGYNNGTVSNSYATDNVTGTTYVGGLVGYDASGTLTANFWDATQSGMADGLGIGYRNSSYSAGVAGTAQAGVTGLTTAQMHTQASFAPAGTDTGQWDFTSDTGTWVMFEGQSNPLLRALMTPLTVTANNASKTYDGLAYNGNADVTYSVTPNTANLAGTLSYTGSSQGAVNSGSYAITPGGLTSNQSYLVSFVDGALTIDKAHLTVTANDASRLYGAANPTLTTAVTGFANNETAATAAGFTGAGIATTTAGNTTNVGSAVITAGAGNLAAANYDFTTLVDGALTIAQTAEQAAARAAAAQAASQAAAQATAQAAAQAASQAAAQAAAQAKAGTSGDLTPAVLLALAALPGGSNTNLVGAYKAAVAESSQGVVAATNTSNKPGRREQRDNFLVRMDNATPQSTAVMVTNGGIKLPADLVTQE